MAHSVSEAAARAVKNSNRKIEETRTPEQRVTDLRGNVKSRLYVAPLDIELLLSLYDAAVNEKSQLLVILAAADEGLKNTRSERDDLAHRLVALQSLYDAAEARVRELQGDEKP